MRVLLFETDTELQAQIKGHLEDFGHAVTVTTDRDELMRLIPDFQVTIFDPDGLADETGAAVVTELRRARCACPIIMLSKKEAWSDKVQGFDSGVDDYLTKPFHPQELLGRAAMLARRE